MKAVELGLVKYLLKPISHDKFLPVLLQCSKMLKEKKSNLKYLSKECIFDSFNQVLLMNNKLVKLTHNERDFLNLLCLSSSGILSYEEIQNNIWPDRLMSGDAIHSLARNLRRKLPEDSLQNLSKIGYKIVLIKEEHLLL